MEKEQQNMWLTLTPIIAKYGIEFAMKLWDNIQSKGDPTPEQWAELRQLAKKTYADYMAEAKGQ